MTLNFANGTVNYIKINLFTNKNALFVGRVIYLIKRNVLWAIIRVRGRVYKLHIINRIMYALKYYQRKKMMHVQLRHYQI